MDKDRALVWIGRWDAQQQEHMPDREERFTALIDAVAEGAGRPDPLVIDLGCGPGSLAVRLLDQIPGATVVAIDADPVLLTLGRAAFAGRPGLRFAELDLRAAGWAGGLRLDRPADAAVSTTALHWLLPPDLAAMYAEAATVLGPGALLLNGDHLAEDETSPALDRLGWALIERETRRHPAPDGGETWSSWWEAVAADPELGPLAARPERSGIGAGHHGSPSGRLSVHVAALQKAGFEEVGTLWQRGANRLLCGVLPG